MVAVKEMKIWKKFNDESEVSSSPSGVVTDEPPTVLFECSDHMYYDYEETKQALQLYRDLHLGVF
jgi:hypothetical protein